MALARDGDIISEHAKPISRGHAEALAPMVHDVVNGAGFTPSDLGHVLVTVGPGSFTGMRVGVAYARALGLALDIPVDGVTTLAALGAQTTGPAAAVLDARRGQVYGQYFMDGHATTDPVAMAAEDFAKMATTAPTSIIGTGAGILAEYAPNATATPQLGPSANGILAASEHSTRPPTPVYVRAPGATPPKPKPPINQKTPS